jgi:hypothetical protein
MQLAHVARGSSGAQTFASSGRRKNSGQVANRSCSVTTTAAPASRAAVPTSVLRLCQWWTCTTSGRSATRCRAIVSRSGASTPSMRWGKRSGARRRATGMPSTEPSSRAGDPGALASAPVSTDASSPAPRWKRASIAT